MGFKEESLSNLGVLDNIFDGARSRAVLEFAKAQNFVEMQIKCVDGTVHPASEYAVHINFNAGKFLGEYANQEQYQESLAVISVLLAMEEARPSCWRPGSEMLYDIRQAGIVLTRAEVSAFLAQLGTSKRSAATRKKLLYKDPLTTCIYCGSVLAKYGTLTATFLGRNDECSKELSAQVEACWNAESPAQSIESLLTAFVPAYVGAAGEARLSSFVGWLRKYGFYTAPADTTGDLACESGLVIHTANLIAKHLSVENPTKKEDFGRIILADVLCSMRKAVLYRKEWVEEKVYCAEGTLTEPDGAKYRLVRKVGYFENDAMPYGEGRTSLHMANGYFGGLMGKDVAAAIDGCAFDLEENPDAERQMVSYPLCLSLHIANTLVTYLDDPTAFG